jgi:Mrp family chromosome partitioning ATPase
MPINKASKAIELDPTKKYLLVFNGTFVTKEDARKLAEELKALGIDNVGVVADTDPENALKVFERGAKK